MLPIPKLKEQIAESKLYSALAENPEAITAELCRRSLFKFVQEFWWEIIPAEPVYNWHIEYLCGELEKIAWRLIAGLPKAYDLIVNIPPGSTKSTLISQMFPAWIWIARLPQSIADYAKSQGKKPPEFGGHIRTIAGSYAERLTLEQAGYHRDIVRSAKFQRYFPELELSKDKDQKSNFKNNFHGQRFSTSVGGTVTGIHAHLHLVDDPLSPKKAASSVELVTANDWMDRTLSSRKVDKAVTALILIMQRLDPDDCTANLVNKKGKRIKHIVLPASDEYEIKPAELKERYVDGLLDPVRMPREVLDEAYTDLTPRYYAGQFGQSPKPLEGGMFSRDNFIVQAAAPAGGTPWVRGWDLAATSEAEAKAKGTKPAYTAGVKMKYYLGKYYIGDVRRKRGSPGQVKTLMYNTATQDGEGVLIDFPQDPGQAGKAQAQDLAGHLAGFDVRYSLESGDKVLRAAPFSAQVEAGNVVLIAGQWVEDFLNEADFFPNGFKDQIDAAVRAFSRLLLMVKKGSGLIAGPGGFTK